MLRNEILNILNPYLGTTKIGNKVRENYWKNNYPEIYDYIYEKWDQSICWSHFLYNYMYDLDTPYCKYCKKNTVSFAGFNKGYKIFCSKECAAKDSDQIKKIQKSLPGADCRHQCS